MLPSAVTSTHGVGLEGSWQVASGRAAIVLKAVVGASSGSAVSEQNTSDGPSCPRFVVRILVSGTFVPCPLGRGRAAGRSSGSEW